MRAVSGPCHHRVRCAFLARVYIRFSFFKKVFTLSHRACFLLIFMRFECEGFDFKAFTPGGKACEGIEGTGIHTGNSWKSGRCGIIAPYAVNTWDFNPSHSKRMKIRRKHALCERVNVFFEDRITYRENEVLGQHMQFVPYFSCKCHFIPETSLPLLFAGKERIPSGQLHGFLLQQAQRFRRHILAVHHQAEHILVKPFVRHDQVAAIAA